MRAFSINDLGKDHILAAFTVRAFDQYLRRHHLCSEEQVAAVLRATPAAIRAANPMEPIGITLQRLLKVAGAPSHTELEAEMAAVEEGAQ